MSVFLSSKKGHILKEVKFFTKKTFYFQKYSTKVDIPIFQPAYKGD